MHSPFSNPALSITELAAPVTGLVWAADTPDTPALCAIASGSQLLLTRSGLQPTSLTLNPEASLLSLVNTPAAWPTAGFISGNDRGELHLITPSGIVSHIHTFPRAFITNVVSCIHSPHLAVAIGKHLHLITANHQVQQHPHTLPSSIGGLAASPIGARLAVSHYGGATVFNLENLSATPRLFPWKGSHLALTYSPNGKWLISAMQEQAIHLWRLADGMDLQMRGYPHHITQFSWSHTGTELATTGGSGVPLWNFSHPSQGPAGQQARVLADSGNPELAVTAVAMHPKGPFCAIGFADGLALLANTTTNHTVLIKEPTDHGAISHLAWSPNGLQLALGTAGNATGAAQFGLTDFTQLAS
jgi:WD40 repeat protein